MQRKDKIILGIDPGTLVMGYGIIAVKGQHISLVEMDVIKLSAQKDNHERLRIIHHTICRLIDKFRPSEFAIEAPFFGKNVQSMLKLGRAQGVAIAAAMEAGLKVTEYSPRKIKQSITGNGNSDKTQVWKMLQRMMAIKESPKFFDATDALAVAICHHFQDKTRTMTSGPKLRSWRSVTPTYLRSLQERASASGNGGKGKRK